MADAGDKKRTFRKFTYRGVELEALLDMNMDELIQLMNARQRRRSVKRSWDPTPRPRGGPETRLCS